MYVPLWKLAVFNLSVGIKMEEILHDPLDLTTLNCLIYNDFIYFFRFGVQNSCSINKFNYFIYLTCIYLSK